MNIKTYIKELLVAAFIFMASQGVGYALVSLVSVMFHYKSIVVVALIVFYFIWLFLLYIMYKFAITDLLFRNLKQYIGVQKIPFKKRETIIRLVVYFIIISLFFLLYACGRNADIFLNYSGPARLNAFWLYLYSYECVIFAFLFPYNWNFAILYIIGLILHCIPVSVSIFTIYNAEKTVIGEINNPSEKKAVVKKKVPRVVRSAGRIVYRNYLDDTDEKK